MPDDVELTALTEQANLDKANQDKANQEAANQAAEAGAPQMNVQGDQKPEAKDEAKKDTPKPKPGGQGGINEDKPDKDIGAGGLNALYTAVEQGMQGSIDKAWDKAGALPGTDKSANQLIDEGMQKAADWINQAKDSIGGGDQTEPESPKPDGEVKPKPNEGIELSSLDSSSEKEDLGLDSFNQDEDLSDKLGPPGSEMELQDLSSLTK